MKKDSTGIEALIANDKILTDPKDKVDILSNQYESVFINENEENLRFTKHFTKPFP